MACSPDVVIRQLLIVLIIAWHAPSMGASGISFSWQTSAQQQDSVVPQAAIDPWRLGALTTVGVGAFTVGHGWLNNLWWKGAPADFHVNVQQDWSYALGADKVGHAYFAATSATVIAGSLRWSGVDTASSLWWGSSIAMAYQTYNEIRDGFSQNYGFSPGDMAGNLLGAAWPLAQHYAPELKAITFQISFYPSEPFRNGFYNAIIDDYESTTHWLSVDVHQLLPQAAQEWYPPWINLALGHSVRGLVGSSTPQHVFVLSLDWNLKRLPFLPDWLRQTFEYLHMYHLPAPAVEITPNVRWVGLRF